MSILRTRLLHRLTVVVDDVDFAFEHLSRQVVQLSHRDSTKQKARRSGNVVSPTLRLCNPDGIDFSAELKIYLTSRLCNC